MESSFNLELRTSNKNFASFERNFYMATAASIIIMSVFYMQKGLFSGK